MSSAWSSGGSIFVTIMADYPQLLHTALDTTDARALAEFYRQLLGLQYRSGDEPHVEARAAIAAVEGSEVGAAGATR